MTDKEKQIEEMAKISCYVCEFGHMFNGECDLGHDDPCSIALEAAKKLYEIGYRKQVEGEWRGEIRTKCDWRGKKQQYFQPNSCSLCHEPVYERTLFCPNCGAKMRGGVG